MNSQVEIVVSDTGQGIAPDVAAARLRALPPGRQLEHPHARRARARPGARQAPGRAARRHGRRAKRRAADSGATFIVTLPIASPTLPRAPAPRAHPTRRPTEPAPGTARLDGLRVLVVDDDGDALDAGRGDPRRRPGAEVRTCRGRGEALDAAAAVASRRAGLRHRDAGRGRLLAHPEGPRARRRERAATRRRSR